MIASQLSPRSLPPLPRFSSALAWGFGLAFLYLLYEMGLRPRRRSLPESYRRYYRFSKADKKDQNTINPIPPSDPPIVFTPDPGGPRV
jgi:hypothetical protein